MKVFFFLNAFLASGEVISDVLVYCNGTCLEQLKCIHGYTQHLAGQIRFSINSHRNLIVFVLSVYMIPPTFSVARCPNNVLVKNDRVLYCAFNK